MILFHLSDGTKQYLENVYFQSKMTRNVCFFWYAETVVVVEKSFIYLGSLINSHDVASVVLNGQFLKFRKVLNCPRLILDNGFLIIVLWKSNTRQSTQLKDCQWQTKWIDSA